MKKLSLIIMATAAISVIWVSCAKEEFTDKAANEIVTNSSSKALSNGYKVECQGSCDCALTGSVNGGNGTITCKCAECIMLVTIKSANGNEETTELKDAEFKVDFFSDYLEFVNSESHSNPKLISVNLHSEGGNVSELYTFEKSDGTIDAVLIAKAQEKKYTVDCSGDCGCTPTFNFQPPSASCSCEDCTMIVTEK